MRSTFPQSYPWQHRIGGFPTLAHVILNAEHMAIDRSGMRPRSRTGAPISTGVAKSDALPVTASTAPSGSTVIDPVQFGFSIVHPHTERAMKTAKPKIDTEARARVERLARLIGGRELSNAARPKQEPFPDRMPVRQHRSNEA